jgi:hypothetical protein
MAIVEGCMLAVIQRNQALQQAPAELKDPEVVFVGPVTIRLALGEVRTSLGWLCEA